MTMKTPSTIKDLKRLIAYCDRNGLEYSAATVSALPDSVLYPVSVKAPFVAIEKSTSVENSTFVEKSTNVESQRLLKLSREYGTGWKMNREIDPTWGREMRNAKGLGPERKTGPKSVPKSHLSEVRLQLLRESCSRDDKRVKVLPGGHNIGFMTSASKLTCDL